MSESTEADEACVERHPYFCYSATLRVFGNIPNLDELTSNLCLTPTHTHRAGEVRDARSDQRYATDMWTYTAPVDETEPLHVHIDALWTAVRDRKEYLLGLKQNATVDVFLGYRSGSDTAGVEIPPQSLQMFTELDVPLGLSIVIA